MNGILTRSMLVAIAVFIVAMPAGVRGAPSVAAEPVSPEECVVEPLDQAGLVDIVGGTTGDTPVPIDQSRAASADDETIDEITEVVRQSVACTNANDPMRALALFTPRYLRERFGGDRQDDLGHLIAALTRESSPARPGDRLSLVSIEDAGVLADGSVIATVTTENIEQRFVDVVVFAWDNDRWLIDRVMPGSAISLGTPVP